MLGIAEQSRTTSRCVSSRTRSIDIERKNKDKDLPIGESCLESSTTRKSTHLGAWKEGSMDRVLDRKPMVSMPAEVSYSFPVIPCLV